MHKFNNVLRSLFPHGSFTVMQHVRNCGPQLFIISRKGGTLLAINDFIYRSNLKRFGPMGDKVYWECIHNRSKKCRSRLKTIGDDLYVTNGMNGFFFIFDMAIIVSHTFRYTQSCGG